MTELVVRDVETPPKDSVVQQREEAVALARRLLSARHKGLTSETATTNGGPPSRRSRDAASSASSESTTSRRRRRRHSKSDALVANNNGEPSVTTTTNGAAAEADAVARSIAAARALDRRVRRRCDVGVGACLGALATLLFRHRSLNHHVAGSGGRRRARSGHRLSFLDSSSRRRLFEEEDRHPRDVRLDCAVGFSSDAPPVETTTAWCGVAPSSVRRYVETCGALEALRVDGSTRWSVFAAASQVERRREVVHTPATTTTTTRDGTTPGCRRAGDTTVLAQVGLALTPSAALANFSVAIVQDDDDDDDDLDDGQRLVLDTRTQRLRGLRVRAEDRPFDACTCEFAFSSEMPPRQ